jgi:hypothetical protein
MKKGKTRSSSDRYRMAAGQFLQRSNLPRRLASAVGMRFLALSARMKRLEPGRELMQKQSTAQ